MSLLFVSLLLRHLSGLMTSGPGSGLSHLKLSDEGNRSRSLSRRQRVFLEERVEVEDRSCGRLG